MIELISEESKPVKIGEPIIFENKTDCSFDVNMGIVFHKSGLYEISILGNRTIVSKVMERKKGRWIHKNDDRNDWLECSECGYGSEGEVQYGRGTNFCPNCGAEMKEEM